VFCHVDFFPQHGYMSVWPHVYTCLVPATWCFNTRWGCHLAQAPRCRVLKIIFCHVIQHELFPIIDTWQLRFTFTCLVPVTWFHLEAAPCDTRWDFYLVPSYCTIVGCWEKVAMFWHPLLVTIWNRTRCHKTHYLCHTFWGHSFY
jgi:hypothetical protein